MAQEPAQIFSYRLRGAGTLAALGASLLLSACSSTSDLLPSSAFLASNDAKSDAATQDPAEELRKATDYWGKEYKAKPENKTAALSYARNLKAMKDKRMALNVLQDAATYHSKDPELMGELGRLALEFDQLSVAQRALDIADVPEKPDWKVISARGTVLAKQGQHKAAIPYFERALALAPNQPSVMNNLAMANAMSGDAAKAEEILRTVAAKGDAPAKVNQNLALVLGLQGKYEESKIAGSAEGSTQIAAENTDYLRRMVRLDPKSSPAPAAPATAAAPAAVATAPLPWAAKTPATAAAATAPAAQARTAANAAPVASGKANDAFKPATMENSSAAAAWQTAVTANAQPAATDAFKGSKR
jgi:Flp pilus assembly protein TadD